MTASFDIPDVFADEVSDQRPRIPERRGVTDRIRNVDVVAPALMAASKTCTEFAIRTSGILGGEFDILVNDLREFGPCPTDAFEHFGAGQSELCLRWISEVAMNVWIRADSAPLTAFAARSISLSLASGESRDRDTLSPASQWPAPPRSRRATPPEIRPR